MPDWAGVVESQPRGLSVQATISVTYIDGDGVAAKFRIIRVAAYTSSIRRTRAIAPMESVCQGITIGINRIDRHHNFEILATNHLGEVKRGATFAGGSGGGGGSSMVTTTASVLLPPCPSVTVTVTR